MRGDLHTASGSRNWSRADTLGSRPNQSVYRRSSSLFGLGGILASHSGAHRSDDGHSAPDLGQRTRYPGRLVSPPHPTFLPSLQCPVNVNAEPFE
ncbi:UNVERIFIED_CONTAM: hypothetical protein PYX00_001968 [Menopon gallinae]|uniref:Uncharacterized protein n=1 Tax=Menopon gallinae TaxID=328185 RepID=A0AAW2IH30_9NEOP